MIGDQRLEGFLGPGTHKSIIVAFAIGRGGIGCIIPLRNHDGQGSAHDRGHDAAGSVEMRAPVSKMGETRRLRISLCAGILMPAHLIGTRLSLLQKALQIAWISVIGHRPNKLRLGGQYFKERNNGIPGGGVAISRHPH